MLGIIADFIASITTILLPAYISYKALRTKDPAQTHPWLIYFTILSLTFLFEQWTYFILGWVPFYAWFRLFFLLYLVLPQTQGAKILYLNYLEPYIIDHETKIDHFITNTHAQLQSLGLGYFNILIEFVREKVLRQQSPQPPPQATGYGSYAQDLLSRFAMPSARPGGASGSGMYGMLSGFAGAAMGGSGGGQTREVSGSASHEAAMIPDSLVSDHMSGASAAEKSNYISSQRERLAGLMRALDTEQQNLDLAYGSEGRPVSSGGLKSKSKSELSFERVDYDEGHAPSSLHHDPKQSGKTSPSGSWVPAGVSGWLGGGSGAAGGSDNRESKGWSAARDITEAMSSAMSGEGARKR